MAQLIRNRVSLAFDDQGAGDPPIVFVHGIACNAGFWAPQMEYFRGRHRVIAVDLRGHGRSDAPKQPYTIRVFSDDLAWLCDQLELEHPVLVGHSLGGLVALDFAAAWPDRAAAAVMIDSVLLPGGDRGGDVTKVVAALRGPASGQALRDYFAHFFGPDDDPERCRWILNEAVKTPPHVTSSVWEQSVHTWDDAAALAQCTPALLYLDAGTPNSDLVRALSIKPDLVIGRTVGSGHFSLLFVPDQVDAMIARFLEIACPSVAEGRPRRCGAGGPRLS